MTIVPTGTARPIVYDVTRLYLGAGWVRPRGVDRADILIAEHLFRSWPGECLGCMLTPWGMRIYPRELVLLHLALRREYGGEEAPSDDDPGLEPVRALVAGEALPVGKSEPRPPSFVRGMVRMILRTGIRLGRSAVRHAPQGAIYVNVGQLTIAVPWLTNWLRRRPDLHALFMVHDAIPQTHPDLATAFLRDTHSRFLDAVMEHADGLLITTRAAADSINAVFAQRGGRVLPGLIAPLPVAPAFLTPVRPDPVLARQAYFVILGAIEPRKNHAILLAAWDRLRARLGDGTPKLIVIGPLPTPKGKAIHDALHARSGPNGDVVMALRLGSPAVRQLIGHARALLMPSFTEGYGLPVTEALALGTPVIASDIPSHREIADGHAILLQPDDPDAWAMHIEQLTTDATALATARGRTAGHVPVTGEAYYERIEIYLRNL